MLFFHELLESYRGLQKQVERAETLIFKVVL